MHGSVAYLQTHQLHVSTSNENETLKSHTRKKKEKKNASHLYLGSKVHYRGISIYVTHSMYTVKIYSLSNPVSTTNASTVEKNL